MNWISIKEHGKPLEPCACWVITLLNGIENVRRAMFLPWGEGLFLFITGQPDQVTHYIVEPALPRDD